jgi:hypothetical protein
MGARSRQTGGKRGRKPTCECGVCEKCKRREYMRRYMENPEVRERSRAARRAYYAKNREKIISKVIAWESERGYHTRDRVKKTAAMAVYRALKDGRLVRPDSCDRCGATPKPLRNGISPIQAHHEDYSRKLDVMWLCTACHGEMHRLSA